MQENLSVSPEELYSLSAILPEAHCGFDFPLPSSGGFLAGPLRRNRKFSG
jgi:hypothetical protein